MRLRKRPLQLVLYNDLTWQREIETARLVMLKSAKAANISCAELDAIVGQREVACVARDLAAQAATGAGLVRFAFSRSPYLCKVILPLVVLPSLLLALIPLLDFIPSASVHTTIISIGAVEYADDGVRICSREPVCAEGTLQVAMLTVSRVCAMMLYVPLTLLFLSMCKSFLHWLATTAASEYLPLERVTELHKHMGILFAVEMGVHTVCHLVRWGLRGELAFLGSTACGLGGMFAVATTALISSSHTLMRKCRLPYEQRSRTHWSFVLLALACVAHVLRLGIIALSALAVFLLDKAATFFFRTYKIESISFKQLDSGEVQLEFDTSLFPGCGSAQALYVQIMIPWVNKEWHPFSVYQAVQPKHDDDPLSPSPSASASTPLRAPKELDDLEAPGAPARRNAVLIVPAGDWTRTLSNLVMRPTRRPGWVQGPFTSPFSLASSYDNTILVATGSGITPALGCIARLGDNRNFFLVWITRSKAQIRFFAPMLAKAIGCFIYYTGKEADGLPPLGRRLFVKRHRPNIESIIDTLVLAFEFKHSARVEKAASDCDARGSERLSRTHGLTKSIRWSAPAALRSGSPSSRLTNPPAPERHSAVDAAGEGTPCRRTSNTASPPPSPPQRWSATDAAAGATVAARDASESKVRFGLLPPPESTDDFDVSPAPLARIERIFLPAEEPSAAVRALRASPTQPATRRNGGPSEEQALAEPSGGRKLRPQLSAGTKVRRVLQQDRGDFFARIGQLSLRSPSTAPGSGSARGIGVPVQGGFWDQESPLPDAHQIVHQLHAHQSKVMINSWCVLYCGGVKAVEDKVRARAKRWRFAFAAESFSK